MKFFPVVVVLALALASFTNVSKCAEDQSVAEDQCVQECMGCDKEMMESLTPVEEYLLGELSVVKELVKELTTKIEALEATIESDNDGDDDGDDGGKRGPFDLLTKLIGCGMVLFFCSILLLLERFCGHDLTNSKAIPFATFVTAMALLSVLLHVF